MTNVIQKCNLDFWKGAITIQYAYEVEKQVPVICSPFKTELLTKLLTFIYAQRCLEPPNDFI